VFTTADADRLVETMDGVLGELSGRRDGHDDDENIDRGTRAHVTAGLRF
jgi:hypothetical protein